MRRRQGLSKPRNPLAAVHGTGTHSYLGTRRVSSLIHHSPFTSSAQCTLFTKYEARATARARAKATTAQKTSPAGESRPRLKLSCVSGLAYDPNPARATPRRGGVRGYQQGRLAEDGMDGTALADVLGLESAVCKVKFSTECVHLRTQSLSPLSGRICLMAKDRPRPGTDAGFILFRLEFGRIPSPASRLHITFTEGRPVVRPVIIRQIVHSRRPIPLFCGLPYLSTADYTSILLPKHTLSSKVAYAGPALDSEPEIFARTGKKTRDSQRPHPDPWPFILPASLHQGDDMV
ncbi:hypothetical protein BDW75DRAFT_2197 [Aspergillus navahoensis]